jgi:hypothetical protein
MQVLVAHAVHEAEVQRLKLERGGGGGSGGSWGQGSQGGSREQEAVAVAWGCRCSRLWRSVWQLILSAPHPGLERRH